MKISVVVRKAVLLGALMVFTCGAAAVVNAEPGKMGHVDLRRVFEDYGKTADLEAEINELAESMRAKRDTMVRNINNLLDEAHLLQGMAREEKQEEIHAMRMELQQFDQESGEIILKMRNDMLMEVMDDIKQVVEDLGKKGGYGYILDARNLMYADGKNDLTREVIDRLNRSLE